MQRRLLLAAGGLLALRPAWAHHGWSSFDLGRPIYLAGRAASVTWRNPHVELVLELAEDLRLPADLATRVLPMQTAPVDGPALLKAAVLPTRKDRRWAVELAPLPRMNAWKVAEIQPGDTLSLVGYTFAGEQGEAIVRVEYLWSGGSVAGLRSSPA
jgi:Family of unknown function (DUF6152)